ncbi:GNAT family N-acetyltransferase [uncultured Flavonifractor sp.]|uniref:GNAT family N-acetyltransferase n=1 Tax=uncultured Flavonifractor sp. TaxID=1193534 RepID=UPI002619E64A|nr:GNAT family N-acetyltransferase [uncultured Flavonifractor sp.]
MKGEEREVVLRDGTRCLLRSPRSEDGEAVLRHLRRVAAESPFTAFLPEELTGTLREEQAFLKRQLTSTDRLMLGCFVGDRLIGLAGLGPAASNRKCRHRAEMGVTIRRRWWGLGLGRTLVEQLCREAGHMGYERMELQVMEDNGRAIALYEGRGFVRCGLLPDAYRTDGGSQAAVLMSKALV